MRERSSHRHEALVIVSAQFFPDGSRSRESSKSAAMNGAPPSGSREKAAMNREEAILNRQ
jgi:hypothetical protein